MAYHNVDWETCADGCTGVRLPTGGKCWAHAADTDLDPALKRLGEDGRLDGRGVPITQELLGRLLAAAPQDEYGVPILTDAQFEGAAFRGDAVFRGATFRGDALFEGAAFRGDAVFRGATFQARALFPGVSFQGDARFPGATFQSDAQFEGATFQDEARFDRAIFQGAADFSGATFHDTAWFGYVGATFQAIAVFRGATFKGDAAFDLVNFEGNAWFDKATFGGRALFHVVSFQRMAVFREAAFHRYVGFRAATFHSDTVFAGATFQDSALFDKATFQRTRQLGPMLVRKSLLLRQAVFHERAQIEIAAAALCCQQARFPAGIQMRVRWAQIVLDDADLAAPSILTGVAPFPDLDEGRWARALERLLPEPHFKPELRSRPRLLSLRRADVAGLTVASVDVRTCRFIGAHHLDQLRVGEEASLGYTPGGWRWTTRLAIAEERYWRAYPYRDGTALSNPATNAADGGSGPAGRDVDWYGPANRPPAWLAVEPPSPLQIAAVYRALRKGREDSRDEPGAADFYYGEMEMRRHDRREKTERERRVRHYGHWAAATTERAVLWLYWLTSGYGLRAWRAIAALAVVIGIAGVGFSRVGFHHPHPSQVAGWLYALQAAVSLESKARQLSGQLTLPGELLRVGLRFTGPVLIGLAVLSIRGRVKR
jgi:uncharacterized protein YjbI with pentapeptide repeats